MSRKVADVPWKMLANAGVKRCYGIVGDAPNPVIDEQAEKELAAQGAAVILSGRRVDGGGDSNGYVRVAR
jgi:hypothetical protein